MDDLGSLGWVGSKVWDGAAIKGPRALTGPRGAGRGAFAVDGHERETELELTADEILADGIVFRDKKSPKEQTQLEVAIGDGMEFTIHGEFSLI